MKNKISKKYSDVVVFESTYDFDSSISLKSGDKILVHTRGFSPISWAIRVITGSFWNHAGDIIIERESQFYGKKIKKIYVVEAVGKKVIKSPIEKYSNTKKFTIKVVRLTKNLFKTGAWYRRKNKKIYIDTEKNYRNGIRTNIRRIKKSIGKRYDRLAMIYLGIKLPIYSLLKYIPLINKIPRLNTNLLQNRKRVFCSENVCECAYDLPNAKVKNPFENNHKNQACSITTPGDIGKSKYVIGDYFYEPGVYCGS